MLALQSSPCFNTAGLFLPFVSDHGLGTLTMERPQVSNELLVRAFPLLGHPQGLPLLADYFQRYCAKELSQTSAMRVGARSPAFSSTAAMEASIDVQSAVEDRVELQEKVLTFSQALSLQDEIHRRLKEEIEDGLLAEARYLNYYSSDEEGRD